MPTLQERINKLFLATGQVVFEDWFENLRDLAEDMAFYGAVSYFGVINYDLLPKTPFAIRLGSFDKPLKTIVSGYEYAIFSIKSNLGEFDDIIAKDIDTETINATIAKSERIESDYANVTNEVDTNTLNAEKANVSIVNGDYGYFADNLFVQGKRVIKDEDPLYIASFFDKAVEQIENAIKETLNELNVSRKVVLLDRVINYDAPPFADIFPNDLITELDGFIRIKAIPEYDTLVYAKFTPYGEVYPVIAVMNDGNEIKAKTFNEFETIASKGDKINVRVIPGTKITLFVYNTNIE